MRVILNNLSMFKDDDGSFYLVGSDGAGAEYTLDQPLTAAQAANTYVRILDGGMAINAKLWNYRAPYGTLAWLADGMEERMIEDEKTGNFLG